MVFICTPGAGNLFDDRLFGSEFFRKIDFMNRFYLISAIIAGLVVALSGGCRRQSGAHGDTGSESDTGTGTGTEETLPSSDSQADDSDSDSDSTTTELPDTVWEETDSVSDESVDTATVTAPRDTTPPEDTTADTGTAVEVMDSDHWKVIFDFTEEAGIKTVSQADDDGVLAFGLTEVSDIRSVDTARIFDGSGSSTEIRILDAHRTEEGIWVTGNNQELYLISDEGNWQLVRKKNGTGKALAHHLAVYRDTLYALTTRDSENAAGNVGNGFLIRWDGQRWSPLETGEYDGWFTAIHMLENGALVAVSTRGLAVFNGSAWRNDNGNMDDDVYDIWGLNENDFWVASTSLWHVTNGVWQEVPPVVNDPLVLSNFSEVSLINGITGNVNDDLYVSVVYWNGLPGSYSSGGTLPAPTVADIANWQESYLAHFDGTEFTVLPNSLNMSIEMQDMALWETELFLSGVKYRYEGDLIDPVDSIQTMTDFPFGRMSVDDNGDLYACDVLFGCAGGARYDGAAWECLEVGESRLVDIVPTSDGIVYGLTTGGAILLSQNGVVTEIHEPKCTVTDYRFDDDARFPVAYCAEGHRITWDGAAWQRIADLPRTGLDRFCYSGDTLFGYDNGTRESVVVRATENELNEVESDRVFEDITCGSSGAVLLDDPMYITDGQRFYHFNGDALTLLATWPLESTGDLIYEYFVSDDLHISGIILKNQMYYMVFWDGATWRQEAFPPSIKPFNYTPDGRLFGMNTGIFTLVEYVP
jgi:hypothetical protein